MLRLALLLQQTVHLVAGHASIAVAGTDVRAVVGAGGGEIAWFFPRQHFIDHREDQIGALERAGHDYRAHHGGELLAGLAERLLHGTRVEPLHWGEAVLLAQTEDDIAAVAVGKRRKGVGDGGADLVGALLDLALLGVVADGAHEPDQIGHFGRVVVIVHNPPPCLYAPSIPV